MFAVPLHGAGQHLALGVAALGGQVFHGFAVVYTGHVLLNDRAFIQIRSHVVGCGTNQLYAPVMRLVVGLGALEAGQERMVDVDGAPSQFTAHLITQNLHIAGQHNKLGPFGFNDFDLLGLRPALAAGCDWNVVKRHVVTGRQLVKIAVVRNDRPDINRQQATFPAEQQIVQAVAFFADQNDGANRLLRGMQAALHLQRLGKMGELGLQILLGELHASELHAHEEQTRIWVVVLRRFFDVAAALQ